MLLKFLNLIILLILPLTFTLLSENIQINDKDDITKYEENIKNSIGLSVYSFSETGTYANVNLYLDNLDYEYLINEIVIIGQKGDTYIFSEDLNNLYNPKIDEYNFEAKGLNYNNNYSLYIDLEYNNINYDISWLNLFTTEISIHSGIKPFTIDSYINKTSVENISTNSINFLLEKNEIETDGQLIGFDIFDNYQYNKRYYFDSIDISQNSNYINFEVNDLIPSTTYNISLVYTYPNISNDSYSLHYYYIFNTSNYPTNSFCANSIDIEYSDVNLNADGTDKQIVVNILNMKISTLLSLKIFSHEENIEPIIIDRNNNNFFYNKKDDNYYINIFNLNPGTDFFLIFELECNSEIYSVNQYKNQPAFRTKNILDTNKQNINITSDFIGDEIYLYIEIDKYTDTDTIIDSVEIYDTANNIVTRISKYSSNFIFDSSNNIYTVFTNEVPPNNKYYVNINYEYNEQIKILNNVYEFTYGDYNSNDLDGFILLLSIEVIFMIVLFLIGVYLIKAKLKLK